MTLYEIPEEALNFEGSLFSKAKLGFKGPAIPKQTTQTPSNVVTSDNTFSHSNPSLPKSSKYLVSRCLEPLKAFSGDVWGFKHLLTGYLDV